MWPYSNKTLCIKQPVSWMLTSVLYIYSRVGIYLRLPSDEITPPSGVCRTLDLTGEITGITWKNVKKYGSLGPLPRYGYSDRIGLEV